MIKYIFDKYRQKFKEKDFLSVACLITAVTCTVLFILFVQELFGHISIYGRFDAGANITGDSGKGYGLEDLIMTKERDLQIFRQRNIFGSNMIVEEEEEPVSMLEQMKAQLSNLELKGVFDMGGRPHAMIFNRATREDYTVTEGDKVGDFTIRKIDLDAVIMDYNGEEAELRL